MFYQIKLKKSEPAKKLPYILISLDHGETCRVSDVLREAL